MVWCDGVAFWPWRFVLWLIFSSNVFLNRSDSCTLAKFRPTWQSWNIQMYIVPLKELSTPFLQMRRLYNVQIKHCNITHIKQQHTKLICGNHKINQYYDCSFRVTLRIPMYNYTVMNVSLHLLGNCGKTALDWSRSSDYITLAPRPFSLPEIHKYT